LTGFRVYADKVTGSKQVRAEPFAAQVQAGNVSVHAADWVPAFLDEAECWPNGRYKDQIDAAVQSASSTARTANSAKHARFKDNSLL
jgi:predicted phage terminase large subunit-like protein